MEQPPPRSVDRRDDPDRPHRASFVVLLVAFLILVAGVAAVGAYYRHCTSAGSDHRPVAFTVADGESGSEVVDRLAADGVIRCGGVVGRLMLQKNGSSDAIRAGTHQLTTGMTLDQAMAVLTTAPAGVPTVSITIPEGFRITQIASVVQRVLKIPASQFVARANSGTYSLPPYLPAGTKTTEGFLFPDTYEFPKQGTTANDVIRTLLDQFATEAKTLPFDRAKALGMTPEQVVNIASMIEREARVPRDRPLIAAVIDNRLKAGIPLGIDATLLYDDPTPDGKLSSSDLATDTPYNTRLHAGLPPTPIASPGRASLLAALEPAHVPYLYYVLCGTNGSHRFSKTYRQFLRDKATCLG